MVYDSFSKKNKITTYPSCTGPIALPALIDSSDIKALVIDSVAPSPPSCYKFLRTHQQNKNQENWKIKKGKTKKKFS